MGGRGEPRRCPAVPQCARGPAPHPARTATDRRNRRKVNAEIRHEHWLDITGQEEYVNPHTGKVELESNQWKNRWQSGNGDVVLSNDPNYDPNHDPAAAHTDFKRSGVRPR
jgi:hypothetical protein